MQIDLKISLWHSGYQYLIAHGQQYEIVKKTVPVQRLEFEAWDDDILSDLKSFAKKAGDEWMPLLVYENLVVDGYHRFAAWMSGYYHDGTGPFGDDEIEIYELILSANQKKQKKT